MADEIQNERWENMTIKYRKGKTTKEKHVPYSQYNLRRWYSQEVRQVIRREWVQSHRRDMEINPQHLDILGG